MLRMAQTVRGFTKRRNTQRTVAKQIYGRVHREKAMQLTEQRGSHYARRVVLQ